MERCKLQDGAADDSDRPASPRSPEQRPETAAVPSAKVKKKGLSCVGAISKAGSHHERQIKEGFTWTVEHFSELGDGEHVSEPGCHLGGYQWYAPSTRACPRVGAFTSFA